MWNDKHAVVDKAIAMLLQRGWGMYRAFAMHIGMELLHELLLKFESPPAGTSALMLGHKW